MQKRTVIRIGGILVALCLLGFVGWVMSLPPGTTAYPAPPVPSEETQALLASLESVDRERPLIAIIGINEATETTDYLMPAGILRRADVAEVRLLATGGGPVQLYPALRVEPDATIAEFDAAHPEGADYVIVPAMSRDDDPAVLGWLQDQSQKGAVIIGICAGAKVVAAAGLLDDRRATTHWYYLDEMLERSPTITYVADRWIVADKGVVTTTGITASMPMMLTLIEAIGGRAKAEQVAQDLGLETWDARHASQAFTLSRPFATTVLRNRLAFWSHEELGLRLEPGIDEVSLALLADAWSRTYRSSVATFAPASIATRSGITILPDRKADAWPEELLVYATENSRPARLLDETLYAIAARYGAQTARIVAMQLEYPEG
jgi:putative intracellular protease/amidase